MARSRASWLVIPLLVALCSFVGGVFGPELDEVNAATTEDDIKAGLRVFSKVYEVVEDNFAEKISADRTIYQGAIPGMLRTLDPHSNFYDPKMYAQMREDQRGRYFGVGMTISAKDGRIIVLAPFPASPAYKAGIRPGDIIAEVNDKKTDNMTTADVADLLRGPRGTQAQIKLQRAGVDKPLVLNVTRDEIPRKSVKDAFWVKPGIMYLDVESFNENTSAEVNENFKRLGEKNVKGLILDLRANPGGLLNEGVAVAGRFLQKGQLVVSHRGRANPERAYTERRCTGPYDYPIVVVVNKYSASAAEIVSGALQDHDRAWVIGEDTFGKGLVQTVYPLSENSGLALTTAKYYTPSGRLIQRDYSNISFFDYYYRKDTELKNPKDVKMTDSGRAVYGGNGIAPDEKFVPTPYNKFQIELLRRAAFFSFTPIYFGNKEAKLPKGWSPDAKVLDEFKAYLKKANAVFTEEDFKANQEWVKTTLQTEFYKTAFDIDEAARYEVEVDPEIIKAIEALPKARELGDKAKKMIVQRMAEPGK
ncbi:MAG: S41 family peptidase [Acidobacteria bacterium]|nr:S41 family peptidase [Acidobacteriota bacterium]